MRQGDGSDLLGPGDPRNAEIGIIYVDPEDTRQNILGAIATRDRSGCKQIAIVLPEQSKAFRQPVDFDGLKSMRRGLKAQLVFIAPPGPGPAEFARQRRFPVYSSPESFAHTLQTSGIQPTSGRVKSNPGAEEKPGILWGSRKSRPNAIRGPRAQDASPESSTPQPIPPTPRLPIADEDTVEINQSTPNGDPGARAGSPFRGPVAPDLDEEDDALLETQVMPNTPIDQQSENRPAPVPGIIAFPAATVTPRTSGKINAVQGSQAAPPKGSGKLPAAQNPQAAPPKGSGKLPTAPDPQAAPPKGSGKLPAAQGPQNQPNGSTGRGSGKIAAVGAGVAAGGVAANARTVGVPPAGAGGPGGPGMGAQPPGLTALRPRGRGRGGFRWRSLLAVLLVVLTISLIVAIVYAQGSLSHIFQPTVTANITITPASHLEQGNYLLAALPTGTPDPAKRQIQARNLTATSATQSGPGNSTGSTKAIQATGPLKFFNVNGSEITIASTVLHGKSGVPISFNGPVFIPAGGTIIVTGFAVNAGVGGNINAFDISGSCCTGGVSVANTAPFTGGQDAVPNTVVQQIDIDNAAKPLTNQLTPGTQSALQQQVRSNERVVDGSLQCPPTVTPDHKVGDKVTTFTVQVSVTCTEEVYNYQAAQQMATTFLATKAQQDPALNAQYALDGKIVTSVLSDTVVTAGGEVSVNMQAQGLWVYQFTSQAQQNLKQQLLKLSKKDAQTILLNTVGVAGARIDLNSGTTMPASVNDITITVQTLPGAQPSSTGTPANTPGGTASPTPTVPGGS